MYNVLKYVFALKVNIRIHFSLQNEHHLKPPAPKAPTHNELRTRRPMW